MRLRLPRPSCSGEKAEQGKNSSLTHFTMQAVRSKGQFVRVNCAAIAETLLEIELFEEASGGTLFLDEIGVINPVLQRKLLRTLQEKEIVGVGGTVLVTVDVRVIAATNATLKQMVKDSSFREDLYYRLNVMPIYMPPLRRGKRIFPRLQRV